MNACPLAVTGNLLLPVAWSVLGAVALIGLVAVCSPRRFSALAARGSQWVDTNKLLQHLDRRIDVDHYVLPFSRWLGIAVIVSAGIIGYLLLKYFAL